MNTYQTLQQKALGLAFILGPLFLIVGAVIYLLGIGLNPGRAHSWIEGIFMTYGIILMIPIYFELARILGQRSPIFGIICAITGLGWGIGVMGATNRLMQVELIRVGLNEDIFDLFNHPGWMPVIIWMLLGMFTSLLLGIGLLWRGGIPRWAAVLLILATIFFVIGQATEDELGLIGPTVFYPLACLSWLVALAPTGLRYLSGNSQVYVDEMATA
jgi:hypothetical protein